MKAPLHCALSAILILAPPRCDAASIPAANRGSLYDYINTQALADGAKKFYLETIKSNQKRKDMIAEAETECGGRYEGMSAVLVELSHTIESDKNPTIKSAKDYTVSHFAKANVQWLVVETISCSMHGGYNQSVLHAALLTGTETQTVT